MVTEPIHIAVLAGGQSRRMGRDKALLTLNGQTLIECVLAAAHPLECTTFIVGDPAAYAQLGPPVYPDHHPDLGPIGGLFTALELASGPVLLLACDLPFLTPDFLRYLISRRSPHQAIVPSTADGSQPLCALYEPSCFVVVAAAIDAKQMSMRGVLAKLSVDEIGEEDWRAYDERGLLFSNLNTPLDYAQAQQRQ